MKKKPKSNLDRFGWSSGQLSYIDENGNKVRIGPISPEDQAMIDKLTAERQDVATWKRGDIEIIRRGSGGPLISEKELDRILADRPDRKPLASKLRSTATAGKKYRRKRS